jgi:hypothetical protein
MEIIPRIGTFFSLVGWGLMILFIGSELSHEANFNYFFLSLLTLFIGHLFRRRATHHESGRFGVIRRAREQSRLRREQLNRKGDEKK